MTLFPPCSVQSHTTVNYGAHLGGLDGDAALEEDGGSVGEHPAEPPQRRHAEALQVRERAPRAPLCHQSASGLPGLRDQGNPLPARPRAALRSPERREPKPTTEIRPPGEATAAKSAGQVSSEKEPPPAASPDAVVAVGGGMGQRWRVAGGESSGKRRRRAAGKGRAGRRRAGRCGASDDDRTAASGPRRGFARARIMEAVEARI